VWLDPEAREVVHHLKYGGYHRLAALMADVISRHAPRPPCGLLVPIPLARRRFRERGYNQAALIARGLSRAWNLPVREDLLSRRREAGSQTALTPEERAANVAGAFTAAAAAPAAPPAGVGPAVIIVDDVLTTGATLVAAAGSLAAEGWRHIGAVTFARALPFERRVIQPNDCTGHNPWP
jgi:predicted amidophosphoribosyltransferase